MKVTVTFFHTLKPSRNVEVDLQAGCTVQSLLERLAEMYGKSFERGIWGQDGKLFVAIMLNGVSTGLKTQLNDGDDIVLVPPIAGG